jgi:hypothetical protein
MSLCEKIMSIDLRAVPVLAPDRHLPRKQQAKMTRELFKILGINGVRVTTPRYANASSVYVQFSSDSPHKDRWEYGQKLQAILDKAFPNHVDRSDPQSDHFDSRWYVRCASKPQE